MIKYQPTQAETMNGVRQEDTVAYWQGKKEEAQAVTVDVSLEFLGQPASPDAPNGVDINPYAIVEYGSDGNKCSVRFDVGLGRRFTVVGNYVSVVVGMLAPREGLNSDIVRMGASIGMFAAPSQAPPTFTVETVQIAAGSFSAVIPVPAKGSAILPLQMTDENGSALLYVFDFGGQLISKLYIPAGGQVGPIPLQRNAAQVRLKNVDAHNPNSYQVIFQLSM